MSAFIAWCMQNPLLLFAALMLLVVPFADLFEGSQGMDIDQDEVARRIDLHFAEPEAIVNRIHAQMVADGLIREPGVRTRVGDVP